MRDRVPAYANGWYQGDREPGAIAELATSVVRRGYRGMKIDPFGAATAELDHAQLTSAVEILEAVRAAVGDDIQLMVEMHGRFSPGMAVRVADAIAHTRPEWIEEPVPPYNLVSLRRVRERTSLPMATGERVHVVAEFADILSRGLTDVVQADLTHIGGLTAMRKLAGWAQAYDLRLAPHNVCGPVGTAANLHFAIATANHKILEHFNDFADPWVADLVSRAPKVDEIDGCFGLPEAPGLGVSLDHDACAEHPRTGAHFNLAAEGWERRDARPPVSL